MRQKKKSIKKILYNVFSLLFRRVTIVALLIVLQLSVLLIGIIRLSDYFAYLYVILTALSMLVGIWVLNDKSNPSYKLAWIIPILIFPIFGGLFYLMFGTKKINRALKRKLTGEYQKMSALLNDVVDVIGEVKEQDPEVYRQIRFFQDCAGFPVYKNTTTEFLSPGEKKFERLLEELKKAKHFIFLEYFIIQEGVMWDSILEILKEKATQGVDVRVMYDDAGCIMLLPWGYDKKLESMGIKCKVFNPLRPVLSISMNNRDHRKILVIDGHTGFTGGINLADEYINQYEKYGHWKDASIMLKGEAVWSLTVMFLAMWNMNSTTSEDYSKYLPSRHHMEHFPTDGYVLPYSDTPLDNENVGEMVYLNIINKAKRYVYIETPYLIVDNELVTALTLAAKNGVDVRIILPHHWDKWYVKMVSQTYYQPLLEAGVKIYEYTPGFLHSKIFIADDEIATVGTINMDYRSLYLHFECGVWMYQSSAVQSAKEDFNHILEVSQSVTLQDCYRVPVVKRLIRGVIKVFAPLM